MKQTPFPPSGPFVGRETLDARKASMRSWLLALMAWFIENVEQLAPLLVLENEARRLTCEAQRLLRRATTALKDMVVLYAVHRLFAHGLMSKDLAAKQKTLAMRRPVSAPPGFRFQSGRASAHRRLLHAAFRGFHRGDFKTRVARLRRALDNLEFYIDLIFERARRRLASGSLSPCAPPALSMDSGVRQVSPAAPNTS